MRRSSGTNGARYPQLASKGSRRSDYHLVRASTRSSKWPRRTVSSGFTWPVVSLGRISCQLSIASIEIVDGKPPHPEDQASECRGRARTCDSDRMRGRDWCGDGARGSGNVRCQPRRPTCAVDDQPGRFGCSFLGACNAAVFKNTNQSSGCSTVVATAAS